MTNTRYQPLIIAAALALVGLGIVLIPTEALCKDEKISFDDDVYPIFKGRCISCHQPGGPGYEKSGFDLSTYEGLMKGTRYGPMVVPGDPLTSNLVVLIDWRASAELRMPHGKKKLSTCDRDAIRTWIRQGAKNN